MLFLLAGLPSFAQLPGYKIFTPEDNTEKIFSIYKSAEGYILVGSNKGLYRFDGSRFYKIDTNKPSLADTVTAIFKDRNKWWTYFYKYYGESFNTYSAPIFLRNYTLCLFYSSNSCGGLCGGGQITLFKKEGNTWKPFKSFCDWVS